MSFPKNRATEAKSLPGAPIRQVAGAKSQHRCVHATLWWDCYRAQGQHKQSSEKKSSHTLSLPQDEPNKEFIAFPLKLFKLTAEVRALVIFYFDLSVCIEEPVVGVGAQAR